MHSPRSFRARLAAAALALSLSAPASAGDVVSRTYVEQPAASGRAVVTRTLSPPPVPAAGVSPLGLALVPAVQIPSEDWSVAGLRIDLLVGRNRDVRGLDVGLLGNEVEVDLEGIQLAGLFNRIGRSDGAWQSAGILNRCEGDFYGLQTAGILNWTDGAVEGVQIALVNRATELSGLQVGLYNAVDRGSGVQIGIVNAARVLDGLQIGLVNVIRDSSVPFFPVVNFAF